MTRTRRRGFSLIEIMVVVVILGLLVTIVGANVLDRVEEARRQTARTQIQSFVTALEMFHLNAGRFPTTAQGLDALVRRPTIPPVPNRFPDGGFIREIPLDPWGNPFIYRSPGERGAFDIISTGRTGEEGGEGRDADITNHDPF